MPDQPEPMTAETFAMLVDPPGKRLELVRGQVVERSLALGDQGVAAAHLAGLLGAHVWEHPLGTIFAATGFILERNPDTVRSPALAFVRAARIAPGAIGPGFVPIAPDLAVEVIATHEAGAYIEDKVLIWLNAGVRLVWVVHPERREIVVLRAGRIPSVLTVSDLIDGEDVVPGFTCPVAQVFGARAS